MSDLFQVLFKPEWPQLYESLALWFGLTVIGTLLAAVGRRLVRRGLLPPQRRRAVRWNSFAVIGVWLLTAVTVWFFAAVLLQVGFFHWLYGPNFSYDRQGHTLVRAGKALDSIRLGLWASAFAFPVQVAAVVGFLRSFAEAEPYQLGLTTARAGPNAYLGFLTCLAVLPAVYFCNVLTTTLYQHAMQAPPEHHVLEQLVQAGPSPAEWGLIVFSAVVMAPVLEELLFRGVLQPWLTLKPLHADLALAATLALVLYRADWGSLRTRIGFIEQLQPVIFVLLMGSVYLGVRARQGSPVPGAVLTSSLLFAASHTTWPQPVPLFVLALALGFLAYRTQSLVASMVLHALFNGFACALLILGLE